MSESATHHARACANACRATALTAIVAVTLVGCAGAAHDGNGTGTNRPGGASDCTKLGATESPVIELALDEQLGNPDLELSGLAWFDEETLVLLPENLGLDLGWGGDVEPGEQFVLALERDDILAAVDAPDRVVLSARKVPVVPPLGTSLPRFDGFEAIVFDGSEAWLSVETMPDVSGDVAGYIVRADVEPGLARIELDLPSTRVIWSPTARVNASEEALVLHDDRVVSLYELNGALINDKPVAHVLPPDLSTISTIPFPHLEYRLTDATSVDANDRFWVMNYSWPDSTSHSSDENLDPDPLTATFGCGPTHALYEQVERLVELTFVDGEIELSGVAPIQMELQGDWADDKSRNWEGVVRLDERGFLVVSDKFPTTVLAFVAYPRER